MRSDNDYLSDILIACELIHTFIGELARDDFARDLKTQAAVIREFEIIGEAARQCSDKLRSSHPAVPWPDVIGMRNVLAHAYHGVAVEEVWLAATRDVPELVRALTGRPDRSPPIQ
ncbi:MAG: DUF86 domain-containing protein [Chloroflexota bacterium]|nr:DUF86 domain-containing protein [Chloroflexota bacterium]